MTFMKEKSYIINSISTDTKICRYMELEKFLQILDGKFFVPRKMRFLDTREKGNIPLRSQFIFSIVNTQNDCSVLQNERNNHLNNLSKSKFLLTSCWTINSGEDYLMWKSYAPNIGVCISTTINNLIHAINYEKNGLLPICSPMFYADTNFQTDFLEAVFTKEKHYVSENEIRFYFVPQNKITDTEKTEFDSKKIKELLLEASNAEENRFSQNPDKYLCHETFDINPNFIESVMLSPFIGNRSRHIIKEALIAKYSCLKNIIKESQINEN